MTATQRRERLHVRAVVLVAAFLRFFRLGEESLWTDELLTLMFVRRWSGLELAIQIPQSQPHLPVYYVLLDAWIGVAGSSEFALRFPSAVFSVAAVGVIYILGREVSNHGVGLVAAALLTLSRFHVLHGQEVRMYSLLTLLVLSSVYLLVRVRADRTRANTVAFGLVTTVLLYTHPFAAFVVLAELVWVLADVIGDDRPAERARRWLAAFAPVGIAALPAPVAVALRVEGGVSFGFVPLPTLSDVVAVLMRFMGYGVNRFLPVWVYLVALSGVGGLTLLGTLGRSPTGGETESPAGRWAWLPGPADERVLFALVFAVALGIPLALSYAITPVFWPRYTIASSLGLFLLVALGTDRIDPPPARYALVGLLLVSTLPQLGLYYAETQKEEWDDAGAHVERNAEPGDLVVVADAISRYGAEHYVGRSDVRIDWLVAAGSGTSRPVASNETVAETVAGEDRVWVMFSHIDRREQERIRGVIGEVLTPGLDREYQGVQLVLYTDGDGQSGPGDAATRPTPRTGTAGVYATS